MQISLPQNASILSEVEKFKILYDNKYFAQPD